jgi:uncharacterized protein YgiM (DUF1202 family)
MIRKSAFYWASIALFSLILSACRSNEQAAHSKEPLDINTLTRFYITVETTEVKTGPGREFRTIGEIKQDSKVRVVGRDGDWLLIVSKKGGAPGFIEMASAKPSQDAEPEASATAAGKYETLADTHVRSGPGLQYSVITKIQKGTKVNVVQEENGWLRVESKRGNKPGYVEATWVRPVEGKN